MNPATYQREKDGYPDVAVCMECGACDTEMDYALCECCEWDLYGDDGAEE